MPAWHVVFMIVALVMFMLAAVPWPKGAEPYRLQFVAAGLFFWLLSLHVS